MNRTLVTNERGMSLLELLFVMAIISTVAAIGIGVSQTIVRSVRGDSGSEQLDGFLRRYREMAIARRRDIEIRFVTPNRVQAWVRAVPDPPAATPAPTMVESVTFEGGIEYRLAGVADTPNLFGNATAIPAGATTPFMFSSDGAFLNQSNDPVNVTISLGVPDDEMTVSAVTVLGVTASIERWRWNGTGWTK